MKALRLTAMLVYWFAVSLGTGALYLTYWMRITR